MTPSRRHRLMLAALLLVAALGWQHRQQLPILAGHSIGVSRARPADQAPRTLRRGAVELTECNLAAPHTPAPPTAAYCATLQVAEDRAHPDGRRIDLAVAVIPARADKRADDAVTFLDGGPGGAALSDYPLVASAFSPLGKTRDILLIDQRGTGGSHAFKCPSAAGGDDRTRLQACADAVRRDADPRFYTTRDATADLDEVRARLGYPRLTVVGVSYGTRVAQVYARDYPTSVRALVLDSPVPNTLTLGSEHAQNLDAALTARFAACVTPSACQQRFGDPMQTLRTLLDRLDQHPLDVTVTDPITQAPRLEHLDRSALAQLVRFYAYSPMTTALLPLTLEEARNGRYQPLLGQLLLVRGDLSTRLDGPLELSILCSEDAALLTENPADTHTILGARFVQQARAACEIWPHASMPADFHAPLTGAVPTLLLVGEFDPVTPPRYARAIAEHLERAQVLEIKGQGHSVMGVGCAPDVIGRFVEHADLNRLEADCLARERSTPFFLSYAGAAP